MEILRAKFSSVDLWHTLVAAIRYAFAEADGYFHSGCREECILVRQSFLYTVLRIYGVDQFHNHRGN